MCLLFAAVDDLVLKNLIISRESETVVPKKKQVFDRLHICNFNRSAAVEKRRRQQAARRFKTIQPRERDVSVFLSEKHDKAVILHQTSSNLASLYYILYIYFSAASSATVPRKGTS